MATSLTPTVRPDRARIAPWAAAAAVGGVCVAAALIDPAGGPTVCPLKATTGMDCPLCGATRAAHHLFRGDLVTALDFNALFVIAAPLLILATFAVFRQVFGGSRARIPAVSRPVVVGLIAAVALFTAIRDLGVAPFDWLSSSV